MSTPDLVVGRRYYTNALNLVEILEVFAAASDPRGDLVVFRDVTEAADPMSTRRYMTYGWRPVPTEWQVGRWRVLGEVVVIEHVSKVTGTAQGYWELDKRPALFGKAEVGAYEWMGE